MIIVSNENTRSESKALCTLEKNSFADLTKLFFKVLFNWLESVFQKYCLNKNFLIACPHGWLRILKTQVYSLLYIAYWSHTSPQLPYYKLVRFNN